MLIKKRLEVQSYISSFYIVVAIFTPFTRQTFQTSVLFIEKSQSSHLGLFEES